MVLGTVKFDEAFDTVDALEIFATFLDDDTIAEVDDVLEYCCCCCSLTDEVVAIAGETDWVVVGSIYVIAPMNNHYLFDFNIGFK